MDSGPLLFQCNVCGSSCTAPVESLGREVRSCTRCGSTGRIRAVVQALSSKIFERDLVLNSFPLRADLKGLGLTDAESYASILKTKFNYLNTYLHKEPRLDITRDAAPERCEAYDFIISSDVFEHVVPPVEKAFGHVYRMLKPGGLFLLTVPYTLQPETIEHFPDLHQFAVVKRDEAYEPHNVTRSGITQTFRNLVFHGGPGLTLEMRVFACSAILRLLKATGFESITVHDTACFRYGIWWPQRIGFPFTAIKPI